MAERARARSDLCKQSAAMLLKAQRLEEELQRVKDEAAKEKKKLKAELEAEKTKVRDADGLLKSVCEGKIGVLLKS